MQSVKENIVIIAGGIGIAPLSMLTENLRRTHSFINHDCISRDFRAPLPLSALDKMQKLCRNINVCTDDGTLGEKGFVTQIFQKDMKKFPPEQYFHLCLWSESNAQITGKNIK